MQSNSSLSKTDVISVNYLMTMCGIYVNYRSQQTSNEAQALLQSMDVDIQFGIAGSHQDQSEISVRETDTNNKCYLIIN